MRTTLDIDDDLLLAAKEIARRERRSAGSVVSDFVRLGMSAANHDDLAKDETAVFGFHPFRSRGGVVTNELIDRLREQTGD
jgi:hypothetical protein